MSANDYKSHFLLFYNIETKIVFFRSLEKIKFSLEIVFFDVKKI